MIKKTHILYQNLLSLYNFQKKRTVLTNKPTYFYIEPTNHCNLKCIMCPNGRGLTKIEKGFMEFSLYRKIIDQIKPFASTVLLAVGGEPLLHPDFSKMVAYAHHAGIKTSVNTNASLLTKELSEQLLRAKIDSISFAFDGATKDSYEAVRRGADFNQTIENILFFLRLKRRLGNKKPYCTLSMLMMDGQRDVSEEKMQFFKNFKGLVDNIRLREVNSWGSNLKEDSGFICRDTENVFTPCGRLWSMLCIKWDGVAVPCICNFNNEYNLGNVRNDEILALWNNSKMVRLRQAMVNKNYLEVSPVCDNCAVIDSKTVLGIPAGIRTVISDSVVNFIGSRFEEKVLNFMDKRN